ncbi:uncharacterized protein LACBIDRAFT_300474 [Laccaria bicolor S238N-H82]|uniref:Predicted protein n=1 Tax=Laccaria bicolor (strain S238N-H82 / ATCC MYA-4686) TaxID=486041 RepID=B0DGV3_LACBS|nr:uncharacterized protein LACBIDRAFT_300474 [Laccaria bicolor S238N-H82]EDR06339.1 predicted protein [Laccaria bicolor S238N-H82]|eukprot:XP_001883200.1 predicted protein [Laccaria bicolor S238N-H82]
MTGQPINPGQPPPPNLVASLLEDRNATSRQIQDLLMEKNGTAIGGVQVFLQLDEPRSCGGSCSRIRESRCGHACPLQCHPGPCPPCQATTRLECYSPRKILSFRYGTDGKGKGKAKRDLTGGNVCGRTLGCGKHTCAAF